MGQGRLISALYTIPTGLGDTDHLLSCMLPVGNPDDDYPDVDQVEVSYQRKEESCSHRQR